MSFVITGLIGMFFSLILPLLGNSRLAVLGPSSTIIIFSAVTYSIVKHRLLDIRLAIRAMILKLMVAGTMAGVFYTGSNLFTADVIEATPENLGVAISLAAIFIVFSYTSLDKFMRRITDSFLFQREYSRQQLLRKLNKEHC